MVLILTTFISEKFQKSWLSEHMYKKFSFLIADMASKKMPGMAMSSLSSVEYMVGL